jgi:poly(3-hydroxybutyrate) depolymerase
MPEEPEIESERLHEAIEEELEKGGGNFLRLIAVTTALFAALAAIAALRAGSTVNEALVFKTEATQFQAQASDQWAYYQAKGIKAAVQEGAAASWTAIGKPAPPQFAAAEKRYADEQAEITKKTHELEKLRDERSQEADHLLHEHHGYADAVALLQVSIALSAIAALTRNRWMWIASLLLGLGGAALFLVTFLR